MKNKIGFTLLFLLGFALGLVLLADDARAQQQSAPGGSNSQSSTNNGPYDIKSTIEVGARGIKVEGNADKYRSDLNYEPGFKVFDATLVMDAKNNDGLLFDKMLVSSFGWHNDPSRHLRVNVEKNKLYKFDVNYRRINYFNSLSNIALQQHISNTEYRQGDFDLVLLPQNEKFKINLGYSVNRNSGPSLISFRYQSDLFPLVSPVKYEANEYRAGFDAKLSVFDISFLQGWRFFKEDTEYEVTLPNAGNNKTNLSVVNTFKRDLPTRGETPYTRLSLHSLLAKKVDITARYIYSKSDAKFNLLETITGTASTGNTIVLERFNSTGEIERPNTLADLGVTVFATNRLRISNTFGVNDFRINGASELLRRLEQTRNTAGGPVVLPPTITSTFYGRTTEYRRFQNLFEVDYDFHRWFSAHVGYRYTDRHIELLPVEYTATTPAGEEFELEEFDNRTNSYIFGFKFKPDRRASFYFDMETGESDNVFTRVSNYDYTNFRLRAIIRPMKTLSLNVSAVTKDNTNPSIIDSAPRKDFDVNIDSRIYSVSADWMPGTRFNLSTGYTRTNVTSDVGVIFFLNSVQTTGRSKYFMRDNFAYVSTYFELHPRARIFAAYRIHHDNGQGNIVSRTPDILIDSYPVQFQSPEARLSIRLHEKLDWVAGYQYFDFKERFLNRQFYQAHLPYTSLKFYFGRRE